MPFKFNPFSGNFDQTGSGGGGGSSYIDGEVQNFSALPQTVGSPAVDSAYLVREAEGAWLLNRKPAGIYIRTANTGTRASDWTYAGEFPDVFNDANLVVYNNTDSTKNVKFDASAIATATTRTLTVPNASGTIQLTGHAAAHASSGSDPLFDQDLNTTDIPTFAGLSLDGSAQLNVGGLSVGTNNLFIDVGAAEIEAGLPISFTGANAATNAATTLTNLGGASDNHVHGNLTNDGKLGSTAGLPVVTTTAGAVTTLALGTANQVLRVNSGATAVEFADPAASGVTGAASSASDVLGVSGANITGVDAGAADRLVFWDDSANKLTYLEAGSGLSISGTTLTATGSGISAVGASTADVLSVSGSDLVADDGGTIDSADPFIKWDDTNSKLVYANPLSRPSGAFYVGLAPTTTAIGSNSVNIQPSRTAATQVASSADSVAIGSNTTAQTFESVAIGKGANAGSASVAIGTGSSTFSNPSGAVALGRSASAGGTGGPIAIGQGANASSDNGLSIGRDSASSSVDGVALGWSTTANLRSMVATRPFNAVYWGGQTTSDTANVELNLDATATNRMVIAANTAVIADISLIARRTDNTKFLAARRWVAIRRDGSNNTALIGAVQTIGTDQTEGSPTWTFTIDADDTASVESLRVRVTGAASETVNWRVCAIYRVVA